MKRVLIIVVMLLTTFSLDMVGRDRKVKYDNGDYYEGGWKKNAPHGFGVMKYANGDVYEGKWEQGLYSEDGKLTKRNGDVYDGFWEEGKRWGHGTQKYSNGDVYEGFWVNDLYADEGTLRQRNGAVYNGLWEKGKRSGHGVQKYRDGSSYDGWWEDDVRSGEGFFTNSKGQVYNGNWVDGDLVEGSFDDAEVGLTYKGSFKNGSPFQGIMEKRGEGFLDGRWEDNQFMDGKVEVSYGELTLKGIVTENVLECLITGKNERFDGEVYFSEAQGNYVIGDYHFTGKLNNWFPVDGKVVGNKTIDFCFDDAQGHSIRFSFGGHSSHAFYDQEKTASGLFGFLEKKVVTTDWEQDLYYEKYLANRLFHYIDYQPYSAYDGLSREYFLVFFNDGLGVTMWENKVQSRPKQESPKTENKTKRKSKTICPACHGKGTIHVNDFDVAGHPRSYDQRCALCNGSGYVDPNNNDAAAFVLDLRSVIMESAWLDSISIVNEDGTKTKLTEAKKTDVFEYVCDGKTVTFNDKTFAIDPQTGTLSNGKMLYTYEKGEEESFQSLHSTARESRNKKATYSESTEQSDILNLFEQSVLLNFISLKESPEMLLVTNNYGLFEKYVLDDVTGCPDDETVIEEDEVYDYHSELLSEQPKYLGGDINAFYQWFNSRLVYPEIAKEDGIQGRVVFSFIVNEDGRLSNIRITRSVHDALDKEVLRVLSNSSRWSPGSKNGKPVKVECKGFAVFQLR